MALRKISGICGIMSQLAGLAVLLLAAYNSSAFNWTENDISFLGVEGQTTTLFNSGLIIAGLFSLVFTIGLGKNLSLRRVGRWGIYSLVLGSISLSAIGLFPRTISLPHNLASITFFVFITLALLFIGTSAAIEKQKKWAVLSLSAAVIIIIFIIIPWPWQGGAIPQLLLCIPWSLWTMVVAVALLVRIRPASD